MFSIEISISYVFALSLTLFIAFDKSGVFLPLAFSVAIHEFSHIMALCYFKAKPKEIKFSMGTINIVNRNVLNLSEEIIALLVGPLSNLLIFLIFMNLKTYENFANINLSLFILNILCVEGLDGGTIIKIVLNNLFEVIVAKNILFIIKTINLIAFIIFFIVCIKHNVVNYTFLFFIVYLFLKLW